MARRKGFGYESPMPDDELAVRMSTSAGHRLEQRLKSLGWSGTVPALRVDDGSRTVGV